MNSFTLKNLESRAFMLKKARDFFYERGVLEVDAPILQHATNIDDHIDPIEVHFCHHQVGSLHTSPELYLKKLLAKGSQDLFFLGHVFRDHEKGDQHQVEFTMVEWYRKKLSYEELIEETLDFIKLFIGDAIVKRKSYQEALIEVSGIDLFSTHKEELLAYIQKQNLFEGSLESESFEDLLSLIFAHQVEPTFSNQGLVVIQDFPKEQAALAKVQQNSEGHLVAKRFEIYYKGLELANGYDELKADQELLKRFEKINQKRVLHGKKALRIDEAFIKANGLLPDCRGVAVGFDRLMMLHLKVNQIQKATRFDLPEVLLSS